MQSCQEQQGGVLNELVLKCEGRPWGRSDIGPVVGQFEAVVQITVLEDKRSPISFQGTACKTSRSAEHMAAQLTMHVIMTLEAA